MHNYGIFVSQLIHVRYARICSKYEYFMYCRIYAKLLFFYFENVRGTAPIVMKEKNQQFPVSSQ